MEKMDEGLKTLLDLGKRRGFLTFDQINDYLPDEAGSNSDKIQGLLDTIDELNIELVNEEEAESRLSASGGSLDDEPDDDLVDEPEDEDDGELSPEDLDEIFRADRRPRADVPDPDGRDPASDPRAGNRPRQENRNHPHAFRRKLLECDYAMRHVVDMLEEGPQRRTAVRPHDQGLRHRKPGQGPDPRADAAQPGDAGST